MDKNAAFVILGLAMVGAGVVGCTVGLATTYWIVYDGGHPRLGLFETCIEGFQVCMTYSEFYHIYGYDIVTSPDFSRTIAGLIVGIIAATIAVILGIIHLLSQQCTTASRNCVPASTAASIIAGTFVIAGIIIFSTLDRINHGQDKFMYQYGYSFHLSLISGIMMLIGGIVFLPGKKKEQAVNSEAASVAALPQHNVAAMQNTKVYGYDQEKVKPPPPPYLCTHDYTQKQ